MYRALTMNKILGEGAGKKKTGKLTICFFDT